MKRIVSIIAFMALLGTDVGAQIKTFEIINPRVQQGDITIIRIFPQFQTQAQGVPVCISIKWSGPNNLGQEYLPNNRGEVFIGIGIDTNSGQYTVIRVECGRGIQLDLGYEKLEILEKVFSQRKKKPFVPTNRWTREREIIRGALNTGAYLERYFDEKFKMPLDRLELGRDRVIGNVNLAGEFGLNHYGVDLITLDPKTRKHQRPVKAISSGQVILIARRFFTEGNMIILDHGSGIFSFYMHLSDFRVKVGEDIKGGSVIGISGQSGRVSGPHLHLAIKTRDKSGSVNVNVDPLKFIETMNKYLH